MKIVDKDKFAEMVETDKFIEYLRSLKSREEIEKEAPEKIGIEVTEKELDVLEKLSKTKDNEEMDEVLKEIGIDFQDKDKMEQAVLDLKKYIEDSGEESLSLDDEHLSLVNGGIDPFITGLTVLTGGSVLSGGILGLAGWGLSKLFKKKKK